MPDPLPDPASRPSSGSPSEPASDPTPDAPALPDLAADFPATRDCAYLNAASIAPIYGGAHEAILEWRRMRARRGSAAFDEEAEEGVFDELHRAAARLFGARPDDIAVASSCTEFLLSLAWGLAPPAGSNVVSTEVAFPSTVDPWRRVCRHTGAELRLVSGSSEGWIDPNELVDAIDADTAVVCVSHVEYASGQIHDLRRLADAVHQEGGRLVVDATQSAGAIPIDVSECGVDALAAGGYKWLCGPFGAAVLYVSPEMQRSLEPGLVGWRSREAIWELDAGRMELPETARRFEFSTMAYGCAVGLARSIDYLLGVDVERIRAHDRALARRLAAGLEERGAVVFRPPEAIATGPIVSAALPGREATEVAAALNQSGVVMSGRAGRIRFSPHLYNTADDIDRALAVVEGV